MREREGSRVNAVVWVPVTRWLALMSERWRGLGVGRLGWGISHSGLDLSDVRHPLES